VPNNDTSLHCNNFPYNMCSCIRPGFSTDLERQPRSTLERLTNSEKPFAPLAMRSLSGLVS
jgi:hypothetical protein